MKVKPGHMDVIMFIVKFCVALTDPEGVNPTATENPGKPVICHINFVILKVTV
jgi:hypothetical protein